MQLKLGVGFSILVLQSWQQLGMVVAIFSHGHSKVPIDLDIF